MTFHPTAYIMKSKRKSAWMISKSSKMLSGSRMINAIELQKIAEFLNVSMESLVKVPQVIQETNTVKAFMGKVESQEAKEGL